MEIICINHNLITGDYVAVENINGVTGISFPDNIFVVNRIDSNTIEITIGAGVSGTYTGGGTLARIIAD